MIREKGNSRLCIVLVVWGIMSSDCRTLPRFGSTFNTRPWNVKVQPGVGRLRDKWLRERVTPPCRALVGAAVVTHVSQPAHLPPSCLSFTA